MDDLPIARTPEQELLTAVCRRLDRQNDLLADLRDRLPAQVGGQPAQAATQPRDPALVTEPDVPAAPENTTLLVEPDPPAKRPPAAKRPAARKPQAKTTTARSSGRAAPPKAKET